MAATPAPAPTALYNLEIEHSALAALLQHPKTWGDFYLIGRDDFSKLNQPLWDLISAQLSVSPQGSVAPLILAEKMKSYGTATIDSVDVYDLLSGLTLRFVEEKDAPHLARELKRLTVRRQLVDKMDVARKELIARPAASFEEMTGLVEKQLSSVTTEYHKPDVEEVMGEGMITEIEYRADNPLTAETSGFLGPFPSINKTFAALTYRGSYTVVGSRSGGGKSSLGWYYQTYLAEKYDLPILHLDAAEMTIEELRWRAVCCLSEGKIPYWAVQRGEWRKNKEWTHLIQDKLWPRVRKIRVFFKNVGSMKPSERIAFIRRMYYQKVGRGNHLLIHDDYLKGMDSFNRNQQEYQAIGNYVNDQKSLITNEIDASIWTSVQQNRSGIITGKKEADLDDSEGTFSISDRILQQSTHSFSLRYKVAEELARENSMFGNLVLKPLKKRQLLGEKYKDMLLPVKLPNGRFVANAVNLDTVDFWYSDKGTLKEMLAVLGQGAVDMGGGESRGGAQPL